MSHKYLTIPSVWMVINFANGHSISIIGLLIHFYHIRRCFYSVTYCLLITRCGFNYDTAFTIQSDFPWCIDSRDTGIFWIPWICTITTACFQFKLTILQPNIRQLASDIVTNNINLVVNFQFIKKVTSVALTSAPSLTVALTVALPAELEVSVIVARPSFPVVACVWDLPLNIPKFVENVTDWLLTGWPFFITFTVYLIASLPFATAVVLSALISVMLALVWSKI